MLSHGVQARWKYPCLSAPCSVLVSNYSRCWLRHLGRFGWEITASCSPFPACPSPSFRGACPRAGVAGVVFCRCRSQRGTWCLLLLELNPAGFVPRVWSGELRQQRPQHLAALGSYSHTLHLHQMILNLMSTEREDCETEEEKYPRYIILLPSSKNASKHPQEIFAS